MTIKGKKQNRRDVPGDIKIDLINHPPHYKSKTGLEAIDVIEAFDLDFKIGNAVAYLLRAGHKVGATKKTDYQKAIWYITRAIENIDLEHMALLSTGQED